MKDAHIVDEWLMKQNINWNHPELRERLKQFIKPYLISSNKNKKHKKHKKTLVVNLYGGPGTGKTSVRAHVFAELKWDMINCEEAPEYAKKIVWEKSFSKLRNQDYIFAKQHNAVFPLLNEVKIIITDSPLLMSLVYSKGQKALRNQVLEKYNGMRNLDIFLKRVRPYNPKGRMQTKEQAEKLDREVLSVMKKHCKKIHYWDGDRPSVPGIVEYIKKIL